MILLEGSPRVLPAYVDVALGEGPASSSSRLGVDVRTGQMVTAIDADGVGIGAERIAARTVLWAAGVAASPLARSLGVPLDRAGRVVVEPDLTIPGHPEVFVIGDLASLDQDGKPVPGVAPAAMQEAKHAARNIVPHARGASLACRSAIATRARSPRSAARRPSPTSAGSSSRACSPGWPGSSSTSSS